MDGYLALRIAGEVLLAIGAFFDVVAAIGMLRLPDFYTRLHALTVGTIGGAVLPLLGVTILSIGCSFLGTYRWYLAGASAITAILILILAPAGSHAIARAAYRSGAAKPLYISIDVLAKKLRRGEGGGA